MDTYLLYGPSCSSERRNIDNQDDKTFKSEYFETVDMLIAELERRFSDNEDLLNSLASLEELDVDKMLPLKNLGKCEKINQTTLLLVKYYCYLFTSNSQF